MEFLRVTDYALYQLEVTEIGKVIKRNVKLMKITFQKNAGKTNPGTAISNINQRVYGNRDVSEKKNKEETVLIQLTKTGRNCGVDVGAIKVM
jgi:hypothetical protein